MAELMPEDLGRYGCPACDDRFPTIGEKKRHLRAKHQDTKPKAKPKVSRSW